MAVSQKAVAANPVRNNGMTVVMGKTNSLVTNAPAASLTGFRSGKHGAIVHGSMNGVDPIAASSDFAKMTAGRFVIMMNTPYLAGVASTVLRSQGATFRRNSIHIKENQRTLRQITAGWNYVTGAFLSGPTMANDALKSIDGSANTDQAARPSRSVPGEFVYMKGAKNPVLADYAAKTG